jgi:UDP-glucose 4-epimerase
MILVTGSSGHLGEALMRNLRESDESVLGVDVKPSRFTDRVGSIADRAFVRECMGEITGVIHTATLHKPHVATHTSQDFVDTNITGTLNLLEEAVAARVGGFVFTSTTSAFGAALTPGPGEPAAWVTEEVTPIPKNIYGVTKSSAESVCELFARQRSLPLIVLRTSRFFPEEDDDPAVRDKFSIANAQANEMLYRRVDLEDLVSAHLAALGKARTIGFGRYIISATTPFTRNDLAELRHNAAAVVSRLFPDCGALFRSRGWTLFPHIDRVYANDLARAQLGWRPKYDFGYVLDCLRADTDFRSSLTREVGSKGYHAEVFDQGPYPVTPPERTADH